MRCLADTNILLRLAQPGHAMHTEAVQAAATLLAQADEVCVFNQSLIEFWNAATRPAEKNGLGLSIPQAHSELISIKGIFKILLDHPAVYTEWERLVVRHAVAGKEVHDTRLVAAMNIYGITHLLTYNGGDFKRFTNLTVIHPSAVDSL